MTTNDEFITIEERHVGKKVIRAFGKRWRLGFRLRSEDVGCVLCRTQEDELELRYEWEGTDQYPAIFEACSCLGLDVLEEAPDETYAIGHSGPLGAVTPWFETLQDLEVFCEENLDALVKQFLIM